MLEKVRTDSYRRFLKANIWRKILFYILFGAKRKPSIFVLVIVFLTKKYFKINFSFSFSLTKTTILVLVFSFSNVLISILVLVFQIY